LCGGTGIGITSRVQSDHPSSASDQPAAVAQNRPPPEIRRSFGRKLSATVLAARQTLQGARAKTGSGLFFTSLTGQGVFSAPLSWQPAFGDSPPSISATPTIVVDLILDFHAPFQDVSVGSRSLP